MNPLVSIIVPVFNSSKYIKRCTDSLLCQDYTNIEIVLVDDGSTDNSGVLCDELSRNNSRLIVIHKKNGGISSARQAGIAAANGEYIMFVDSDDWIEPNTITLCMEECSEKSIICVAFSYIREYEDKSEEVHPIVNDLYRKLFGPYGDELKHPEQMNNIASCCMKLYHKSCMNNAKFFNAAEYANAEDTLFNIFALSCIGKTIYLDKCLYHYNRVNETSLTRHYRSTYYKDVYRVYKIMFDFVVDNHLDEQFLESINNRIVLNILSVALNELQSPSVSVGISNIRYYLKNEAFRTACESFSITSLTLPWKIIFLLCRFRLAGLIYCAFFLIEKIMK